MTNFNLKDWDPRTPINSDITKPWGEYHVFQDFDVAPDKELPNRILQAINERFQELLAASPHLQENKMVISLADKNNNLSDKASADEKILVVEPKQPGYQILSMQYHGKEDMAGHIEIWEYLTDGVIVVGSEKFNPYGWSEEDIKDEMQNLKVKKYSAGEIVVILPGQWHALAKPANVDYTIVREWRITPETGRTSKDREENIVRTYDNAGRGTLGSFPKEIMHAID